MPKKTSDTATRNTISPKNWPSEKQDLKKSGRQKPRWKSASGKKRIKIPLLPKTRSTLPIPKAGS